MKNSKDYSKKIQKLHSSLSRKYPKVQKIAYDEPVDAVVYAVISSRLDEKTTEAALKRFSEYFVDLNDLRVSRTEEIVEMLGGDSAITRAAASQITTILRAVFNTYHKVSLEPLKKMGKRPARQVLEKLEGTDRYVVDYCMLAALHAHAIPLTGRMIEYLRDKELVHPDADEQQISGFLAKQISAKKGYEFFTLLRRESEAHHSQKDKKAKTPSAKKKTTTRKKKTTAKKTTPVRKKKK
jgi:endonuclease III